MKILLTGASGYLGQRLALRACRQHEVVACYADRSNRIVAGRPFPLDLLSAELRQHLDELRPDAIIHAAAINPGGDEALMMEVNAVGSGRLAALAAEHGVPLIHVSTDVVHDGTEAPYADDAPPSPIGAYAESKAAAETEVLRALPTATLVRTSLIYGLHAMDHGTAGFAERLRAGQPVCLFRDVLRQPVWVESLAAALLEMAAEPPAGFVNIGGDQVLSRDEFGRRLLEFWQVDGRERVTSVDSTALGLNVPQDLRLRTDRARRDLGLSLPGVDEVLAAAGGPATPRGFTDLS